MKRTSWGLVGGMLALIVSSPGAGQTAAGTAIRIPLPGRPHAFDLRARLETRTSRLDAFQLFGIFRFLEWGGQTHRRGLHPSGSEETVWQEDAPGEARLTLHRESDGAVRIRIVAPSGTSRVGLGWRLAPGERLYGLGSRTHGLQNRGRNLTCWVEEGGNGKSDSPLFGVSNLTTSSHVPVPFLVSSAGYALWADTTVRTQWDLGATDPDEARLMVDAASFDLVLFPGVSPVQALERFTARVGRPAMPPTWAFAPAEWGKGGSAAVRAKARFLREHRIPCSTLWFEDWVGLEHGPLPGLTHLPWGAWDPDLRHYPGLGELNADLEQAGFKSLGYFNPFVPMGTRNAEDLLRRGVGGVVREADGRPMWWPGPFGMLSMLDLSDPEVQSWIGARIAAFEQLGFDGAMADFGEWTPWRGHFRDGQNGAGWHNRYPDAWAEAQRRAWLAVRPGGDFVVYHRSGYSGIASRCTYMWAADQNTDWGRDDGFPTALTAILSAGLSGVPLMTHDVGGFATLGDRGTTRELYMRWVELGAYTTFMRTHSGQKPGLNWHVMKDEQTASFMRTYATRHMDLVPYRMALVAEANRTGMPPMRPMVLAAPDEPDLWSREDQFMLGPDLLVAPVLEPGISTRSVGLPRGTWYPLSAGEAIAGGRTVTLPAPLEQIPVLARAGAVLPMLPEGVQTLLPTRDPEVPGWQATQGHLRVLLVPGAPGEAVLVEETRITHVPPARPPEDPEGWTVLFDEVPLPVERLVPDGEGNLRLKVFAPAARTTRVTLVHATGVRWEVSLHPRTPITELTLQFRVR